MDSHICLEENQNSYENWENIMEKNVVTVQLYKHMKNLHSALNLCRHRDVFHTLIYDKLNVKPKQA